jgi:hypothetical protein
MATVNGIDNFESGSEISVDSSKNWNPDSEALIRNYIKQCSAYCVMYDQMRISYKKTSDYINLTNGIIGALITGLSLITVGNNHLSMAITISTIFLGIVVSVNSVLKSVWNLDKLQSQLVAAHYDYTKIYNHMRSQSALERNHRIEATKYLNTIRTKLEYCVYNHPTIDEKIKKRYIKHYGNMFDINDMEQQTINVVQEIEHVRKSQHEIAIMTKQRSVQPSTPTEQPQQYQVTLPTIHVYPASGHTSIEDYEMENASQPSVML